MIHLTCKHMPPSVNDCFANNRKTGGRHRTKRYATWANAAGYDLKAQKRNAFIAGAFTIAIVLDRKSMRSNSDIDNRVKPILDLLQTLDFIKDDKFCERLTVEKGTVEGGGFEIFLDEITVKEAA
ncbi:Holliday junction resolvase RusA-like endonuclease [Maritalea mobilis]|uniref:Holliday junction resolvase RusA-like endonuclease n=1 Tax=Maritalea mobilis TaxID=483324 RepID=A0A4R6VJN6_9HYPH|nr:RusA family crossover junction endodeoxyribonuclease [Maritalea mobilis]TDQ63595.1 Holliday junction resolvase RusA-like endonuclease [Maritalea mobilis]